MTTRVEMLKGFPRNLKVCEAGTRKCTYANYLVDEHWLDPEHLYLIDIDKNSHVDKFVNKYSNVTFFHGKFENIVKDMQSVDLVYIDGLHSYENVYRDLQDFDSIANRWLSGHDWVPQGSIYNNHLKGDKFEVREAVTDWLTTTNYYLTFVTDDISNKEHDPDANWPKPQARPLLSWVVSKTIDDHNLFLENLEIYNND